MAEAAWADVTGDLETLVALSLPATRADAGRVYTGSREIDLLVLDPEIGVVNIEVKDSSARALRVRDHENWDTAGRNGRKQGRKPRVGSTAPLQTRPLETGC